ncbi:hypothetical protein [Calidifontibacter indicus]|uniref:hypothetical protein n=1 Tax=Calidifontibacter indicus TaxID=419650 RepID=UPI003D707BC7
MRRLLAGGGVLVVVALALAWFLTARGAASTGELDASVWVTHHRLEPLTSLSTFIDVAVQPICIYVLMGLAVLVFWIGGRGWDLVTEVILFLCSWGTTSLAKVVFQRQRTSLLVVAALVRMGVIDPLQDAASKPLSAGARTSGS